MYEGSTLNIITDLVRDDLPVDAEQVRRAVFAVLEGESVLGATIDVILSGHDRVHELNRIFLNHDYRTDVLSFMLEASPLEGEVYIDLETARERHEEFGVSLSEEVSRYAVHGTLHLIGYDDESDEDRLAMSEAEDRYLEAARTAHPR